MARHRLTQTNDLSHQTAMLPPAPGEAAIVNDCLPVDPAIMHDMWAAALSADRSACSHTLVRVLALGVAREDIADHYIPNLARRMGAEWSADQLSFAEVTIGTSRLQSMLRELGPEWSADSAADPAAPTIMLVVSPKVDHTLGALVLAGQLRRKGFSVALMLGSPDKDIVVRLKKTKVDAVFLSCSKGEALETMRQTIHSMRTGVVRPPPVVIGGTILDFEVSEQIASQTGADFATKSIDEAIALCSLEIPQRKSSKKLLRT